jgi:glycosyltransferase involved in cell wall biosynthesis
MKKETIVISAINAFGGGVLSVLQDCLLELTTSYALKYHVVALVYDKNLIGVEGVEYYEFPEAKSTWFRRLYYEYVLFYKISKQLKPAIWLSLADVTPRVAAPVRVVYCHNLAPFCKISWREAQLDPILAIYHYIFKYIYQINIKKNKYVIVQQQWLREEFEQMFGIKNVLVAYPKRPDFTEKKEAISSTSTNEKFVFFYPSLPRVFKNFELIAEAVLLLRAKEIINFEVIFTIDGTENKYASYLLKEFGNIPNLNFIGQLNRNEVFEIFERCDGVLFPSKIETWGMGISEGILFDKPILAIDAPYAKETAGNYDKIKFFPENSPEKLAEMMKNLMENNIIFDQNIPLIPHSPFAKDWHELLDLL